MITRETIRNILEESVQAPSGENAQPWRFGVKGNEIHIFNIPERDQSPYNFRQRASFVAHGTLLENIVIVASEKGFQADIRLLPEKDRPDLSAIVTLMERQKGHEPLYPYIISRVTNRKPYRATPLTPEEKNAILSSPGGGAGSVLLTEDKASIRKLAYVGSMNERLVFENRYLHDFLFEHISWTEEENQRKKIGFDIKTLELPPPARAMFKFFRSWGAVRALNPIGLSHAIWHQNGMSYAKTPAIGVIAVPGDGYEDLVEAGRLTQRMWLTATKLGLSVQPMTGILFFMQRILADHNEPFSGEHVERIKQCFGTIRDIFHLKDETVVMMFRIGHGDPPTAQSLKLPPIIEDLH